MKRMALIVLISFFNIYGFSDNILADKGYKHNSTGNKCFDEKKYTDAIEEYTRALSFRKDNSEIKYNLANSLFESGKFEEALKSYENSEGKLSDREKSNLYYNMGNTFFKMDKLKEAGELYKKSLMLNPEDKWAKENFELALKKLEQQKQQQNKEDKKDDKDQKDKNKDKDKQKQEQDKKDEKKKEQQNQEQQQEQKKEEKKQNEKQNKEMRKKENREKLLKALEAKEKENRKENAKKKKAVAVDRPIKDW